MSESIPPQEADPLQEAARLRGEILSLADTIWTTATEQNRPSAEVQTTGQYVFYNMPEADLPAARIRLVPPAVDGVIQTKYGIEHVYLYFPFDRGYFADPEGKLLLLLARVVKDDGEVIRHAITRKQFLSYPDNRRIHLSYDFFESRSHDDIGSLMVDTPENDQETEHNTLSSDIEVTQEVIEELLSNNSEAMYPKETTVEPQQLQYFLELLHTYKIGHQRKTW